MASYDDLKNNCYVLEHGNYKITLNKDSHTAIDSRDINVDKDIIYNNKNAGKRSSDKANAKMPVTGTSF